MDAQLFLSELRKLTPDVIRQRLSELAAEEKTLRLLLRASLRASAIIGKERTNTDSAGGLR